MVEASNIKLFNKLFIRRKLQTSVCKPTVLKRCVSGQGPTCSCGLVNTPIVQLTCSASYADSTYNPIAAIFTLYVNGSCTTSDTPQRTSRPSTGGYAWISTSTFTTAYSSSSTYQCGLTFSQPTAVQDPSVAVNAPTFDQKCVFPVHGEFRPNFVAYLVIYLSIYKIIQRSFKVTTQRRS